MHRYQPNIAMICIGGGGSNVLNAVLNKHPELMASMAVNRYKKAIERSRAAEKVLLNADTPKQIAQAIEHYRRPICRFLKTGMY